MSTSILLCLFSTGLAHSRQQGPEERFQAAVALYEEKRTPETREALASLFVDYDTPENRQNIELDSLLAGSFYYLGEPYFLEDRFAEAAVRYAEVIAIFRTFRPESYYHSWTKKVREKTKE